jgi:hypothetical protein
MGVAASVSSSSIDFPVISNEIVVAAASTRILEYIKSDGSVTYEKAADLLQKYDAAHRKATNFFPGILLNLYPRPFASVYGLRFLPS